MALQVLHVPLLMHCSGEQQVEVDRQLAPVLPQACTHDPPLQVSPEQHSLGEPQAEYTGRHETQTPPLQICEQQLLLSEQT